MQYFKIFKAYHTYKASFLEWQLTTQKCHKFYKLVLSLNFNKTFQLAVKSLQNQTFFTV